MHCIELFLKFWKEIINMIKFFLINLILPDLFSYDT